MSMETNNFPDRIYLPRDVEYPQVPDVWWEREPSEDNVEYVKTTIIIDWLEENLPSYWSQKIVSTDSFIEDFKGFVKENKL